MSGLRNAISNSSRAVAGAAAGGLAIVSLALSVIVAGDGIGRWEVSAVDDARGVTDVVGYPARVVMQLGTSAAALTIALAAAVHVRRWRPPVAIFVAWSLAWIATRYAKVTIERPRPDRDLWREHAGYWGYPSGHTSTAFALATVVAALLPRRWRWAPFAVATVVGLARMHVAVHYPMDLVGGALIGLAAGLAAVALVAPGRAPAREP
jgi:membrane-associated phospholipid phosphatase